MDYEKAYNEMVQRARELHDAGNALTRQQMEIVCPELAESEDETTRKELLNFVRSFWADHKEKLPQSSRWVNYLEKQKDAFENGRQLGIMQEQERQELEWPDEKKKEQKPDIELLQRSWYMEGYHDGKYGNEPKWIVKTGEGGPHYEENPKYGQLLKEQKPAWSEEDEDAIQQAILALEDRYDEYEPNLCFLGYKLPFNKAAERLKSLRPSWKPSKEQMSAICMAKNFFSYDSKHRDDGIASALASLESNLKKMS